MSVLQQASAPPLYHFRVKDLSPDDRPREKLLQHGPGMLSTAELLGLLIGSGSPKVSAIDLAKKILKDHHGDLGSLVRCSSEELTKYEGIGPAKAALILSCLEICKRYKACKPLRQREKFLMPGKIYKHMQPYLTGKSTEEFWLLLLRRNGSLIRTELISKGGISQTIADPVVIFGKAVSYHANCLVLVHNHPSGDPSPSVTDISFTERLKKSAELLQIRLLDHLIFTDSSYFSFADEGMI